MTVVQSETKLCDNYLAVMTAAITLAEKWEVVVLGIFQYIMDEMLSANDLPKVKFPTTVISDYQHRGRERNREKTEKDQDRLWAVPYWSGRVWNINMNINMRKML